MAVGTVAISAAEQSDHTRDYPLFMSNNILDDLVQERWSDDATFAGSDDTDDDNPPELLHDRRGDLVSRPTPANSISAWYYMAEVNAGTDSRHEVDSAAILGHNLHTLAATLSATFTITVEVDDDSAFGTAVTIAQWTIIGTGLGNNPRNQRLGQWVPTASSSTRYQDITHVRVTIATTADFTTALYPIIGEIWVGRRQQMPYNASRPFDYGATYTEFSEEVYPNGRRHGVILTRARWESQVPWRLRTAFNGRDGQSILRTWWRDALHGRTSLFCPRPTLAPSQFWLVRNKTGALYIPETGYSVQETTLDLGEEPPFLAIELYG